MYKNVTLPGTITEMRNVENEEGGDRTVRVTRTTGLIQPRQIDDQGQLHLNSVRFVTKL